MRDRRENDGRVSKRSSTGIKRDSGAVEKREPIRNFEEADDLYRGEHGRDRRQIERYDRRGEDDRADRYDRRYDRRRDDRDGRYDRDDRYDRHYDRRRDEEDRDDRYDRHYDRRRDEEDRDDRYDRRYDRRRDEEDRRRDDRYDSRDYDTMRRSGRREAPRWDDYRFDDDDDFRDERGDDRRQPERRAPQRARRVRGRRVGGDTELFVHQILPYAMFWIGLFAAVSFILRDLVGLGGSAGFFGSWLADALGGLMGPIAYALPLWLVVLSLRWKKYVKEGLLIKKLLLSASFLWLLSGIVHVFSDADTGKLLPASELYTSGALLQSGGIVGGFLGEWMGYLLYPVGTGLLAIPLLLVIGIYLVGMTPGGIWQRISCKLKMASAHRAERMRERYDGREERSLRVKSKKTDQNGLPQGEAQAEPAREEAVDYSFGNDEDEYRPEDGRSYKNVLRTVEESEEPPVVQASETLVKDEQEPASRVRSAAELLDIPEDMLELDEPELDEPEDDVRAILDRAGHGDDTQERLDQIIREVSEQSAQAPQTPPAVETEAEERVLQGTSYSPFALHQHFIPREKPAQAAVAEERIASAPTVSEEPKGSYLTEESLGSLNPIHRVQKQEPAPTVAEESAVVEPIRIEVAYSAPVADQMAQQPTVVPTVVSTVAPPRFEEPAEQPITFESVAPTMQPAYEESAAEPVCKEPAEAPLTVGGFSFAAEETEPASSPVQSAAPAAGIRTAVGFAEKQEPAVSVVREDPVVVTVEPVAEPIVAEAPVVEEPRPARVIPMRPKAQVLTRTEPVQEEKKPTPPPAIIEYHLPHIELLKEDVSIKENDHTAEMQEKIEILRETLRSFNIRVKDQVDCSRGPTITRYELRPEAGVSVRSVMNRMDDISLNMAAPVRIEAPIPGKPAIGIEVPNAERETVFMRTVLESEKYKGSTKPLEVPLGLDVGGEIQMCDLAKMPHLLVAGSTGSGKSVCINTILISLMYKTSPNDLRLILIDPKQVEFTSYNHIPHLYAPIVTDPARAVGVLACAVQEMERRYSLIKDVGVRNIEGYNEVTKNDPEREHLPYMVIVIDEFADLKMACTNNDVETFTCRLAQKARAAGMHLIIGTQRPTVNVITGNLKNNIPSRIAFKVTQQTDSRTILDSNGAECLLGRGDMLYMTAGLPKPNRVQGAFVSDEEVEAVAEYIRNHNDDVQYNQAFMDQIEAEMARAAAANRKDEDDFGDDGDDGDEDPKFYEAVELAIETQKVATSLLQRRLGVGYGRAAKIIDRMEALGYVSAPEGNKARKVLITHAEYASMMEGDGGEGDY